MNSFIESIASFLAPPSPALRVVTVTGPVDYSEVPDGFFNVETASGEKSLGYHRGSFLSWKVGATVVDGGKRVTLTTPRSELPTVKLNFQRSQQNGAQHVSGSTVIDTDTLDGDNSTVVWDGAPPASGVGWR